MSNQVRVGVIGNAWPGQRHIEAYQKHVGAKIVALSDVNLATAEQVKAEYKVEGAKIYGDYLDLLADDSIDAVSICTPNFLHSPMAIDALHAGKHVMLEKPLAHTLADGERLAAAVAAHPDQKFMIAFNNRYRPDSILLRQRIDAGELGRIYYAKTGWLRGATQFTLRGWFTQKQMSGGGPLIDLGVHMLDLSLWFMGNPRPVSVTGSVYREFSDLMAETTGGTADVEDLATAFVKLDNGATIVLDVSWLSHIEQTDQVYTQLFGSNGGATIDRGSSAEANGLRINTVTGIGKERALSIEQPDFSAQLAADGAYMLHESFRGEISDFVDSILENRQPGTTITHALDILRVLDAIYRSAESGKEIDLRESTLVSDSVPAG